MSRNPTMKTKKTESTTDDNGHVNRAAAHLEAMETTEAIKAVVIKVPQLQIETMKVKIIGDSPLICHRWSEKAKKQILGKQLGEASPGREIKNPEQDYLDSLYPYPGGGYGFPTIAFKNAMVTACTSLGKSVTKVQARQAFHVMGELVKIDGKPERREDMVRVGMGSADIRFRGEFKKWSCTLQIRFNARVLTRDQLVNMLNTAGFAVGVGEWRSEKDGSYGLFTVEGLTR